MAGDRPGSLMSHIETRTSSLIIFFIFVDSHKQRIISVYEDTNLHKVKQKYDLQGFHRLALIIKMEHAQSTQPSHDVRDVT